MALGFERKLVNNLELEPINPHQCGKQKCAPGYTFGPFTRDFWLLHFVISGKGQLINSNGVLEVKEDEMFVIRPNESVSYRADDTDPWSYIWIGFRAKCELPEILFFCDKIHAPYLRQHFISAYHDNFFDIEDTSGAYEHFLCGAIWQILGKLAYGNMKNNSVFDSYVKPAINIMKADYHSTLTVYEIADRLHISKGYFSDIFKKSTGVSPKKYLNDIRMKKAAELIKKEALSITLVATSVGYPDVFTFSRAFKSFYGCSPSEFRSKK